MLTPRAGTWGAGLTAVHLAAAATWVGALVATTLAVLAWRREPAAVRWVITGYMRLAVWTFAVVIGTGVVSALLLLPLSQVFSTDYGRVLVIKLTPGGRRRHARPDRAIYPTQRDTYPEAAHRDSRRKPHPGRGASAERHTGIHHASQRRGATGAARTHRPGAAVGGARRPDRGRRRRQRRATGGAALGAATRGLLRRPTRPALHRCPAGTAAPTAPRRH